VRQYGSSAEPNGCAAFLQQPQRRQFILIGAAGRRIEARLFDKVQADSRKVRCHLQDGLRIYFNRLYKITCFVCRIFKITLTESVRF